MYKVNTNPEVILHYLQQNLNNVTNRQQSLWFTGTELYSYHSLLAIIDPANKVLCIDKDIRCYSNTTAKQTRILVSRANRANFNIFSIPLETSPEKVLMYYWNLIEGYIAKYNRAIKHKEYYNSLIKALLNEAELYANYTQINKKSKEYKYKTKLVKQLFEYKIL